MHGQTILLKSSSWETGRVFLKRWRVVEHLSQLLPYFPILETENQMAPNYLKHGTLACKLDTTTVQTTRV